MKNIVLKIFVVSIVLALSLPLEANAQAKGNYIVGKAGIYSPSGDLDDMNFDTGLNGEIAFGHYLHRNIALELSVGYLESDSTFAGFTWDFWDVPISLTAKGVYPLDSVELYAGAGIAMHFAQFEVNNRDFDDTVFGGRLMLGASFDVARDIILGIEGAYILTDEVEFSGVVSGRPLAVQADLNGYTVTGNIGFRF